MKITAFSVQLAPERHGEDFKPPTQGAVLFEGVNKINDAPFLRSEARRVFLAILHQNLPRLHELMEEYYRDHKVMLTTASAAVFIYDTDTAESWGWLATQGEACCVQCNVGRIGDKLEAVTDPEPWFTDYSYLVSTAVKAIDGTIPEGVYTYGTVPGDEVKPN